MRIELHHTLATAAAHDGANAASPPSSRMLEVASMFGLGVDQAHVINLIPPTPIDLHPSQLIFITGPSGSGKSTLLRLIAEAAAAHAEARVLRFDQLDELPDRPLVDCFDAVADQPELASVLHWLSLAGLNDAFVMLRRPSELSDGQRYRLRLAQAMAVADVQAQREADAGTKSKPRLTIVLADEFGATLDRLTARVLARNVRKWVSQAPVCFAAATTHDDLLESLEPDILIEKHLGERMDVIDIAHPARGAS